MCHRRTPASPFRHATLVAVLAVALGLTVATAPLTAQTLETVVEVRVHGNQSIPDADVLALAGVAVGDRVDTGIATAVEQRLLATGRFDAVEVRKRYRSLTVSDEVALILVVQERAGSQSANPISRLLGRFGRNLLVLPVLDYAEGYGFGYGGRVSAVDLLPGDGRISVPATWGGTKQIALEMDQPIADGWLHRIRGGVGRVIREHPRFEIDDDRTRAWLQVDRRLPGRLRAQGTVGWADVRFGGVEESQQSYGLSLELDTRADATAPRDAVVARVGAEWLDIADRPGIVRSRYEIRGYLGLARQAVLVLRATHRGTSGAVPRYEQELLGGGALLRGWSVGELVGDRAAAASAELRLPVGSPLAIGGTGFRVFFDTGTVYNKGETLHDGRFRHGAGVGLFVDSPLIRLRLDVAHNLVDRVRLHVGAALGF